jgi:peptidoglycan DL-endopeptidase CwlO
MHHKRLVGGLFLATALLLLLAAPSAVLAEPSDGSSTSPTPSPEPAQSSTPTPTPSPTATASPAPKPQPTKQQLRLQRIRTKRAIILKVARNQLGIPYVWGGAGRRGFDCSGLTMYLFKRVGWNLAHGATLQAKRGKRVSLRSLRVGDLVFYGGPSYYHHVALYVGGGKIIHAPRRGSRVSYSTVRHATLARRLIGN